MESESRSGARRWRGAEGLSPGGGPCRCSGGMDTPHNIPGGLAQAAPQQVATDALIGETGGLVFLTTGSAACEVLDEVPVQVALTPVIAFRLSEILKVALQYPDRETRLKLIADWTESERLAVPHATLDVDERCIRVGIEPLGAGCNVAVLWEHVPGLTFQLAEAARRLAGPA